MSRRGFRISEPISRAPILLAALYGVTALGLSLSAAQVEGRLFSAVANVHPFRDNISTIVDFALLNPLVIFFLTKSAQQKKNAYYRMGVKQPVSLYHRIGWGLVALSLGVAAMKSYVAGFLNGSYLDATIILHGGTPTITTTGWIVFTFTALFIAFIAFMAFEEIVYVRFILALHPQDAPYAPFHADESGGLRFLADPSLTAIYAAMSIAAIFLIFIVQDHIISKISASNRLYLISIYAPSVLILLGLPLYRLHLLMVKRRQNYLNGIAAFMDKTLAANSDKPVSDVEQVKEYLSIVECVEKYRKLCSELPRWPIPVKSLIAPASSAIASLAPLLQKLVEAARATS